MLLKANVKCRNNMNIRNFIFITILLLPSVIVLAANSVAKSHAIGTLLSITDLASITLLPFIGGLIFKTRMSYLLSGCLPILFIATKSLYFDGAERIVAVGLVVFICSSVISCSLAVAGKYLCQKHLINNSSGSAQKHAAP